VESTLDSPAIDSTVVETVELGTSVTETLASSDKKEKKAKLEKRDKSEKKTKKDKKSKDGKSHRHKSKSTAIESTASITDPTDSAIFGDLLGDEIPNGKWDILTPSP
jgi:hypothetical protein